MIEIRMSSMWIIETKFGIFYILTCPKQDIVMDDWNLNEKPHCKIYHSQSILQGMMNNVRFTFCVGNTTRMVLVSIEQDK